MSYIKKEPIIEFITKGLNNPDDSRAYGYDAVEILAEVEYSPTVDVVEVVRCKDCKYFYQNGNIKVCKHWNCHSTTYDAYCSYAKMKEGVRWLKI